MLNSAAVRLFECSPRASKISLAQLRQALDILKKLIPRASPLFVWAFLLTQNNRALVLNTTSRHEEAAMVLQSTIKTASALPHEAQQSDAVHLLLVDTWLNYCSSLSNLKKHKRAYTCAVNALKLLERMAIQSTSPLESTRSKAAIQLAIAQFNMGLELQQLKCYTCVSIKFGNVTLSSFLDDLISFRLPSRSRPSRRAHKQPLTVEIPTCTKGLYTV